MPTESEILARVEAFAADLLQVIRSSTVDLVEEALAEMGRITAGRSSGRARLVGSGGTRAKGEKRDPAVLEALVEKLGTFIKKNPGQRIEQIGNALSLPTKELTLPMKKLIAQKLVKTKGEKRATTYFAARAGGAEANESSSASKPRKAAKARKPAAARKSAKPRKATKTAKARKPRAKAQKPAQSTRRTRRSPAEENSAETPAAAPAELEAQPAE